MKCTRTENSLEYLTFMKRRKMHDVGEYTLCTAVQKVLEGPYEFCESKLDEIADDVE